MSRYRRVQVSTYTDDKFLQLTPVRPSGQSLWLYLLTGRHTTAIPGLSAVGLFSLAEQLRWPLKDVKRHWREIESRDMGKADWEAPCIWLPNAPRYNKPESPNVVKAWAAALREIPACDLRSEAIAFLQVFTEGLGYGFGQAFREGFAKAFHQDLPQDLAYTGSGVQEQEVLPPNPPLRGGPRFTRRELASATDVYRRAFGSKCQHEPACPNSTACIHAIAERQRELVPA